MITVRKLSVAAALAAMLLFGCGVPHGQPPKGSETLAPNEILGLDTLYAQNCAGCHGAEGRGGAAIALADPLYSAIAEDAAIRKVIASGVRGTSMPAFAESSGGMLADKQIDVVRVVGSFADSGAEDFARPGLVFPLRCRAGGVLERRGHTEAAVDLSRLAGLHPSGVICEILKDDGTMARVPDLVQFCRVHQLKMITIEDLVSYRFETDNDALKDADLTSDLRFHHSSLST